MFANIDSTILKRLISLNRLVLFDTKGRIVNIRDEEKSKKSILAMVGPVQLPLLLSGGEVIVNWYAVLRRSALNRVTEIPAGTIDQNERPVNASRCLQERLPVFSSAAHSRGTRTHSCVCIRTV